MAKYRPTSKDEIAFRPEALQEIMTSEEWPKTLLMTTVNHTSYGSIDNWLKGKLIPINCLCKICSTFGIEHFLKFFTVNGKPINATLTEDGIVAREPQSAAPSQQNGIETLNIVIEAQKTLIAQQQTMIDQLQSEMRRLKQVGEVRPYTSMVADDTKTFSR